MKVALKLIFVKIGSYNKWAKKMYINLKNNIIHD